MIPTPAFVLTKSGSTESTHTLLLCYCFFVMFLSTSWNIEQDRFVFFLHARIVLQSLDFHARCAKLLRQDLPLLQELLALLPEQEHLCHQRFQLRIALL